MSTSSLSAKEIEFIKQHQYLTKKYNRPHRRHSTKQNPGPKLYLGYELENLEEAYAEFIDKGTFTEESTPATTPTPYNGTTDDDYTENNDNNNDNDDDGNYDLHEIPVDNKTNEAESIALAIGIPVDESAHMAPLLAGSNIGSRAYHSLQLKNNNNNTGNGNNNKTPTAPLNLKEYKMKADSIIQEFFLTVNYDETVEAIEELSQGSKFYGYIFVSRLLVAACSATDKEREYCSRLLSTLYGIEFSMEQIGKGFVRFFEYLSDYEKDIPNINTYATKFLARAISDEILPPAFLTDPLLGSIVGDNLITDTRTYLTLDHATERLEHIWMVNGAFSIPELKKAIKNTLEEYFINKDVKEVGRCIQELLVPYFHHEVIYRTIVIGLDKIHKEENVLDILTLISTLFKYFNTSGIISNYQIERGIDRITECYSDLLLDSPRAGNHLSILMDLLGKEKIIDNQDKYSNYFRNNNNVSKNIGNNVQTTTSTG